MMEPGGTSFRISSILAWLTMNQLYQDRRSGFTVLEENLAVHDAGLDALRLEEALVRLVLVVSVVPALAREDALVTLHHAQLWVPDLDVVVHQLECLAHRVLLSAMMPQANPSAKSNSMLQSLN